MEQIKSSLFTDPQEEHPAAFCEICGGALYLPSLTCIRCERRQP